LVAGGGACGTTWLGLEIKIKKTPEFIINVCKFVPPLISGGSINYERPITECSG
jgi:hypothetical protein